MADSINLIKLEYEAKNLDKILSQGNSLAERNEKLINLAKDLSKGLDEIGDTGGKVAERLRQSFSSAFDIIAEKIRKTGNDAERVTLTMIQNSQKIQAQNAKNAKELSGEKEIQTTIKSLEELRKQWQANEREISKSKNFLLKGKKDTPIESSYLIQEQKILKKEIKQNIKRLDKLSGISTNGDKLINDAKFHDDRAEAFTLANNKQREARDYLSETKSIYEQLLISVDKMTEKYGVQSEVTKQEKSRLDEIVKNRQAATEELQKATTLLQEQGKLKGQQGQDVLNRVAQEEKEIQAKQKSLELQRQHKQEFQQTKQQVQEIYSLEEKIEKLKKDKSANKTELRVTQQILQEKREEYNINEKILKLHGEERQEITALGQKHKENLSLIAAQKDKTGQLGETFKKVFNYVAVYRGFAMVSEGIQKAIDTMKELDKAFTDIQMVTMGTDEQTAQLAQEYNALAKSLGSTTIEVAEGAGEWLRQGKSAEETTKLLTASMTLSKVGAIESSKATQLLTSSLNGYKLSAEDAMGVVDKISAIDLAAATSSEELTTALARTANIANDSSVSFDKLLTMIGTVSSVTRRSASTIRRII